AFRRCRVPHLAHGRLNDPRAARLLQQGPAAREWSLYSGLRQARRMALEIERKFRVSSNGWEQHVARTRRLRQAYLSKTGRLSIRIRIDGDNEGTLTIKAARSGLERHEYEYAIPVADAEELMLLREGS